VSLDLFERSVWIASLGFLVIGSASILLAVPQRWHHGFAYLFVVLDVGLVLGIPPVRAALRDEGLRAENSAYGQS
jgi:adenylate cyclase